MGAAGNGGRSPDGPRIARQLPRGTATACSRDGGQSQSSVGEEQRLAHSQNGAQTATATAQRPGQAKRLVGGRDVADPEHAAESSQHATATAGPLHDRGGRAPGEAWADWNTRTLRMARVHLQQNKVERWSTHILRSIWGLWGHVARAGDVTFDMLMWRGMQWWRQQQQLPPEQGARHAARFNSSLDTERHITAIAGERWGERAKDRLQWESLAEKFLHAYDPPWSSGKQAQLENLAQTCGDTRAARAIENPGRRRTAGHRFSN